MSTPTDLRSDSPRLVFTDDRRHTECVRTHAYSDSYIIGPQRIFDLVIRSMSAESKEGDETLAPTAVIRFTPHILVVSDPDGPSFAAFCLSRRFIKDDEECSNHGDGLGFKALGSIGREYTAESLPIHQLQDALNQSATWKEVARVSATWSGVWADILKKVTEQGVVDFEAKYKLYDSDKPEEREVFTETLLDYHDKELQADRGATVVLLPAKGSLLRLTGFSSRGPASTLLRLGSRLRRWLTPRQPSHAPSPDVIRISASAVLIRMNESKGDCEAYQGFATWSNGLSSLDCATILGYQQSLTEQSWITGTMAVPTPTTGRHLSHLSARHQEALSSAGVRRGWELDETELNMADVLDLPNTSLSF
ncbi:hypothetical protein JCM24511_06947 [Saitozyma sp. JCM 24511]|nr:hypothetical protein JCM24511_06947 [Saitozyma sp. JCM 24511]